jgi:hypothetical protein
MSNGQQIKLSVTMDANQSAATTSIKATRGSTCATIAAGFGRSDQATAIQAMNKIDGRTIRSIYQKFPEGQVVKLPNLSVLNIDVLCDNIRPQVTDGYAIFETVARPGRTGVNKFDGYNPIAMILSLRFEAYTNSDPSDPAPGKQIEKNIATLEQMAGRGQFAASGRQVPPVVGVSTDDGNGNQVWLIPSSYQWSPTNKTAPQWRITLIAWDNSDPDTGDGPLSDNFGRRVRQKVAVTLTQYTPVTSTIVSAAARAQTKATAAQSATQKALTQADINVATLRAQVAHYQKVTAAKK